MEPTPPDHRRIDAIRDYLDNAPGGGEMKRAERSARQQWVREALNHVGYEELGRDDRGFVRQYIQRVTGYSRAAVERHIAAYRESQEQSVAASPVVHHSPSDSPASGTPFFSRAFLNWRTALVISAVLILFGHLRGSDRFTGAVPLSPPRTAVTHERSTQEDLVVPSSDDPAWIAAGPQTDIAVRMTQRRNARRNFAVSVIPETSAPETFAGRIEERRNIRAVSAPTKDEYARSLVASLQNISGSPAEGQIVVYKDGKAVWGDLPVEILRGTSAGTLTGIGRRPSKDSGTTESSDHEAAPEQRFSNGTGGGRGGGGGGGSGGGGGTTITNITTTTTTTGLDETAADDLYVNESGDSMDGALTILASGVGLNVFDTASGSHLHAERLLTSSGTLIIEGVSTLNGALTVHAAISGSTLTVTNLKNCDTLDTNAAGVLSCGTDEGGGVGITTTTGDPRYVNVSGDSMTGGLLIASLANGTPPAIDAGLLLEVVGTASGKILHAQDQLRSSGALVVQTTGLFKGNLTTRGIASGSELYASARLRSSGSLSIQGITNLKGAAIFGSTLSLNGVTYTFPGGDGSASGKVLKTNGAGQLAWSSDIDTDTDTNTVTAVGRGLGLTSGVLTLNSTITGSLIRFTNLSGSTVFAKNTLASSGSLKVLGTASGGQLHASNQLRSSGTLSIQGITNLKGAAIFGSTLSLNGVTYTFPGGDGSASGKVLKTNGAGQLAWSSDIDTDTDTNTTYTAGEGLSLTGTTFSRIATMTGTSLEIFGTSSGRQVYAADLLRSSGALVVDTTGLFKGNLTTRSTASGAQVHASNQLRSSGTLSVQGAATFKNSSFRLLDSGFANCTALETVDGVLTCGSDGGGTSFVAGQGITLNGANAFSTNSILTGSLIRFTNLSGSTVFAKNTLASSGSLKVLGTASGGQLHASNQLRSSGTLSIQGAATFKSSSFRLLDSSFANCTALETADGVLTCGSDGGGSSFLAGQGITLNGANAFSTNAILTGSLIRFTNLSGSTVFAKNTLASSGSLKVLGTASGGQLHASNQLRSSGTLSIQGITNLKGATIFGSTLSLNGVTYTFPGGDGSASGKVLKTNGAGQLAWSSDIDTDANTTYTAGEGLSLVGTTFSRISTMTGTSLEIFGTSSGRQVYAADVLRSSGSLTVQGATTFKSSSFRLLDSSFANCTALETADGVLTCGSDAGTAFLAGQGITLNGANAFSTNAILTGSLVRFTNLSGSTIFAKNTLASSGSLKVLGTASGGQLHASNQLRSSGTLSIQGAATFKSSSFRLLDSSFANCTALETADGVLTCGSDGGGTSFVAGQGITLNGANAFSTNSILTGSLIRFTNLSGSTVFAKNTLASSGSLKVLGTASGGQLHASNQLRSSGTLSIQGITNLKGAAIFGSTLSLNGVTYTFPGGDGSASGKVLKTNGAGQLAWSSDIDTDTDTNTVTAVGRGLGLTSGVLTLNSTITGSLVRFTNLSGSTVFAKNTLASSGSLKVLGTASGGQLHASNQLRSSGTLSIQGITNLKGAAIFGSTLSLNGVTYTFPGGDGSASGKVLKTNGAGQLAWSSDIDTDTDTNTTYTAGEGLSLTGTAFSRIATMTGTSLEIFGTASGRQVYAADLLKSSGSLIVETTGLFKGNLTTRSTSSGAQIHASNQLRSSGTLSVQGLTILKSDLTIQGGDITGANGATLDLGEATSGDITVAGDFIIADDSFFGLGSSSGRFEFDDQTTDEFNILNASVGIGTATPKTTLEVQGTMSGSEVIATRQLRSSGSLSIAGAATFKNSSFRLLDSGFADCTALETVSGVLTCGSDGGTSFSAGQGITITAGSAIQTNAILTGSLIRFTTLSGSNVYAKNVLSSSGSLKVLGTASGAQVHASNQLRSSGTLSVQGLTNLKGAATFGSTLSLNGVTYTFPGGDGSASGKVLKTNGAGQLAWSSDIDTDTDTNTTYTAGEGLSLTGTAFSRIATMTGTSLEIFGTASGRQVYAADVLRSSGSLTVQGAATFKSSSFRLLDSSFANCTALETADGVLTCGSDGGTAVTAGQGLTLSAGNAFSTNAILTGSLIRFTNLSGSTIFAKNTLASSGSLKVLGTASGGQLHASNQLRSSGTLSVQGTAILKGTVKLAGLNCTGNTNGGAITAAADGTLSCTDDDSGAGGAASLVNYYVNAGGDSMTGGLLIQSAASGVTPATIDAGLLLEVIGTMSGRVLHAQDLIHSSGAIAISARSF
ncbi:MAG: hypothetical protein HOO67_07885, partial [Candidatus Peribacteraceae bacterium]|nr:hypothetical protein [Candidatus Peribacteraceae bacterium]